MSAKTWLDYFAAPRPAPFAQGACLLLLATVPFLAGLNTFYYIDDGLALELASRGVDNGESLVFSTGFNGHFRPLPILSWTVIYRWFGSTSPIPYRVFSMLLHMTIVGMTWRWLRHLLGPGGERCAWICAAVFAIHWYATEAATYIAALGVLWSMLGGLWSCFGVIMMRQGRPMLGLLQLWTGMAVALGGGEYGVATVPLILVTAAATSPETSWTARSWRAVRIGLLLLPLLGTYIGQELLFANHERVGSRYVIGWHIVTSLSENIGRMAFPSPWIGPELCLGLLIVLALAPLASPAGRAFYRRPMTWLMLAGALAALLPFAPSLQGNYGRFLYMALPLFTVWLVQLLHVLLVLLSSWRGRWGMMRRHAALLVLVFLLVNLFHLEKRILRTDYYAEPLRQIANQCQRLQSNYPTATIWVWPGDSGCECPINILQTLHRIEPGHVIRDPAQLAQAGQDILLVLHYDCAKGAVSGEWRHGPYSARTADNGK